MLLVLLQSSGDVITPVVPAVVIVKDLRLELETQVLTIELDTVD